MRIVAISDLHGYLPPTLPSCDLLLIAGDICPDFIARGPQRAWFIDKFIPWLEGQPAATCYATWGNHDWLPRPSVEWGDLTGCRFLKVDELVEHPYDDGTCNIWFSPWSNQFGHWAWMDYPFNLGAKYAQIPEGTDIIVSHGPPFGFCDTVDPRYLIGEGEDHLGSHELLEAVTRVNPAIVICGHIHGGHGVAKHLGTTIYNVSLMTEAYQPINPITVIDL